jgi:hypothetical protein
MHILKYVCFVAVLIVFASMGSDPQAQAGVTITFPSVVAAGPDFATEVLNNPWDMCDVLDLSQNPDQRIGFSSFNFLTAPCRAGGTTALVNGVVDSSVTVLDRGVYQHFLNPGQNGRNFPIDTSRYRILSYKLLASSVETPQIFWFHTPIADPSGDGMGERLMPLTSPGAQIQVGDLTQSLIPGMSPWTSGVVRGIRFDPNSGSAGGNVFLQWMRLTTAAGASGTPGNQNITWSGGSGNATVLVTDGEGTVFQVASNATSPFLWNYGTLPPGTYTLTVNRTSGSGSKSFRINTPSQIEVTSPSLTSGADYATTVLGNPWDMSDPADVQLSGFDYFTPPSFSGGLMTATNTTDDPNVSLLFYGNNSVPIDTAKYRYLTIRFQVDGPYDLGLGSVGRFFWTSNPIFDGNTATTSLPFIVWEGMNSYTFDLTTLATGLDGGLESSGGAETWLAATKPHLRFDPHEFLQARTFHIDDIKLTAKPVATTSFTIKFNGTDADGDAATVSLYYDTDTNPNNGKTLIASGIPQSTGQYIWNASGVPAAEYFIYAESSDGVQTSGRYSTVPVIVAVPPPAPTGFHIVS